LRDVRFELRELCSQLRDSGPELARRVSAARRLRPNLIAHETELPSLGLAQSSTLEARVESYETEPLESVEHSRESGMKLGGARREGVRAIGHRVDGSPLPCRGRCDPLGGCACVPSPHESPFVRAPERAVVSRGALATSASAFAVTT
jgi:hypothetical protein